jgi:hypothetical protein
MPARTTREQLLHLQTSKGHGRLIDSIEALL